MHCAGAPEEKDLQLALHKYLQRRGSGGLPKACKVLTNLACVHQHITGQPHWFKYRDRIDELLASIIKEISPQLACPQESIEERERAWRLLFGISKGNETTKLEVRRELALAMLGMTCTTKSFKDNREREAVARAAERLLEHERRHQGATPDPSDASGYRAPEDDERRSPTCGPALNDDAPGPTADPQLELLSATTSLPEPPMETEGGDSTSDAAWRSKASTVDASDSLHARDGAERPTPASQDETPSAGEDAHASTVSAREPADTPIERPSQASPDRRNEISDDSMVSAADGVHAQDSVGPDERGSAGEHPHASTVPAGEPADAPVERPPPAGGGGGAQTASAEPAARVLVASPDHRDELDSDSSDGGRAGIVGHVKLWCRRQRAAHPAPLSVAVILLVVLVFLFVLILKGELRVSFDGRSQAGPDAGSNTAPKPPSRSTNARSARVLVAVDQSASMDCPLMLQNEVHQESRIQESRARDGLQAAGRGAASPSSRTREVCSKELISKELADPHRRLTRMEAVRNWTGLPKGKLGEGDELGIWGFYTLDARPVIEKIRRLGAVGSSKSVGKDYASLKAVKRGGTSLYDVIDRGVQALIDDAPTGAVKTLIVLTDGGHHTRAGISQEDLHERLRALGTGPSAVRVLVTAISEERCAELRKLVGGHDLDGDCYDAPTPTALSCVSGGIRLLLRTPYPEIPRDRETKKADRQCTRPPRGP